MARPFFDSPWLESLHAAARQAPLMPRVPLWSGESVIGSVEPDFFLRHASLSVMLQGHEPLLRDERSAASGWRVMGDVTTSLNRIAVVLHEAGLAGAWRGEQLAVADLLGKPLGTVERAAVRPLGIVTRAVHLVGQSADGRFWVQQRALDKSTDPGLWDTLMGGMVSAVDTVETALARETWEEAGLQLHELQDVRYGGRVHTTRPSADGGAGYVDEYVDWYSATVPTGMVPDNQDGEVAQFRLMEAADLAVGMQRGDFTLEAALILCAALGFTAACQEALVKPQA
ncbi:MAG: NUDIX domain-containing protein [Pseudomonadota bacterium]